MPRSRAVVLALALVLSSRAAAGQGEKRADAGPMGRSAAASRAETRASAPDAVTSPKRLGRPYPAVTTRPPKSTRHPSVRVSVVRTQPANLGGRRAGQRSGQPAASQAGLGAQTPAAPGVPFGARMR